MWHLPTLSSSSLSLGTSSSTNNSSTNSQQDLPNNNVNNSSTSSSSVSSSTSNNQIVPETMQVKDEFNHSVTSNYATNSSSGGTPGASAADYSLQNLDNYYTKTEEVPTAPPSSTNKSTVPEESLSSSSQSHSVYQQSITSSATGSTHQHPTVSKKNLPKKLFKSMGALLMNIVEKSKWSNSKTMSKIFIGHSFKPNLLIIESI